MTGAELKTLRESLGLSQQWLAHAAEVGLRTVQYWEADNPRRTRHTEKPAVPEDVADLILGIRGNWQGWVTQAVDTALAVLKEQTAEHGAPAEIALYRYRADEDLWAAHPGFEGLPATYHAAGLMRVKERIEADHDLDVVIEYADER